VDIPLIERVKIQAIRFFTVGMVASRQHARVDGARPPHISRLAPLVRLVRTPGACRPAPTLGMHTEAILAELGYEARARSVLAARGVILPLA
jgi:crotonobetainyl-CoA:carnitine CoA-transferase CaiB-like acyl-CoA transferase